MRWLDAARTRLRLLFQRRAADSRMDEEFRFHIEMEAEKLMREQGLSAAEARRRALVSFGGMERHRETLREDRGLAWLGGLSLDLRLGWRLLAKYPGLTIVGGSAMAFAVAVGAVVFELVSLFVAPPIPLPDGDRLVHLRNWDVQASQVEPRVLHDVSIWEESLRSVTDMGAWWNETRNLMGSDGDVRPVQVAAITATGLGLASTVPLHGRVLVPEDEAAGAPPVVVLGHDVWRDRFAGDPSIIGRSVRMGDASPTVVGVMPDGFTYPIAHEAWIPLRADGVGVAPLQGPAVTVVARLAPGASVEEAQAELSALGDRSAADFPATHAQLRPEVKPYAWVASGSGSQEVPTFRIIQLLAVTLLVLICANVALLLFARAATRQDEILVRSALGASRRRIVLQLFAEALVLGTVAGLVGLLAAHLALAQWGLPFLEANLGQVPFWYDPALSPRTVLYACALTLLAAAIAGGLPGLKVVRGIGTRLRASTSGGGGLQFGGVWTVVIVLQVALTVAFPAVVLLEMRELDRIRGFDMGFAAQEFLAVQVALEEAVGMPGAGDPEGSGSEGARLASRVEELRQRLEADPAVLGVTFVDQLPLTNYTDRRIALDDLGVALPPSPASSGPEGEPLRRATVASIDPAYFDVLGASVLAGRGFDAGDLGAETPVAIVDEGFVDQVLSGRNPVGQRVRVGEGSIWPDGPDAESLPWREIVGVVPDLGMIGAAESGRGAGLYLPERPGLEFAPWMLIHTRGDPMAVAPRVRAAAAGVDPTLRLTGFQRADQVTEPMLWVLGTFIRATALVTTLALVLSLAGIYAVLSFIVARKTREIGIRVALGADRRRLVTGIFRRPLTQVGFGVAAGTALIALGALGLSSTEQFAAAPTGLSAGQVALLAAYAGFMLGVCLVACIVPTWRALRVEPVIALRSD